MGMEWSHASETSINPHKAGLDAEPIMHEKCTRKGGISQDMGRRHLQRDTKMTGYNWRQIEIKASPGQKTVVICGLTACVGHK